MSDWFPGGADQTDVNFGFAYSLIVNTGDDANADSVRSQQGSLRQFLKNANAITGVDSSYFNIATSDPGYNGTGKGKYTIQPDTALVMIDDPIVLDGTTHLVSFRLPLLSSTGRPYSPPPSACAFRLETALFAAW